MYHTMIPNFLRFSDGHTFICLFDVDGQLVVEKGKGRPKKDNNNENIQQDDKEHLIKIARKSIFEKIDIDHDIKTIRFQFQME